MQLVSIITENLSISEIISFGIGLLGVALSIYFYLRSKQIQKPKYQKISSTIDKNIIAKDSPVYIQNGNERLERLTITKVAFWNNGITLKKEDVSSKSPFRIELKSPEDKFVYCNIVYAEEENDISCDMSEDKHEILLDFDYLARNQGFVVKLLHTGQDSSSLEIEGSMRNEGKLKKSIPSFYFKANSLIFKLIPFRLLPTIYSYMFMLMGFISIIAEIFRVGEVREAKTITFHDVLPALVLSFLIFVFGFFMRPEKMPQNVAKAFYEEN